MVKTTSEILEAIRTVIGDNNDDSSLTLIEDVTDTLNDFDNRTKDSTDWKNKYAELDKEWRKKYRDRFFSETNDNDDIDIDEDECKPKVRTFESLFETK